MVRLLSELPNCVSKRIFTSEAEIAIFIYKCYRKALPDRYTIFISWGNTSRSYVFSSQTLDDLLPT